MLRPITNRNVSEPDPKYSSILVGRLINYIMREGKKSMAAHIVYTALGRQKRPPANRPWSAGHGHRQRRSDHGAHPAVSVAPTTRCPLRCALNGAFSSPCADD